MAFSVELEFKLLSEVSLYEVYDETGVYVLWNSSAETIPSYIGEGHVLSRFTTHLDKQWARRPLDGFIALVRDGTPNECKWKSVFGEMALLDVSIDIFGRLPTHNKQDGKENGLNNLRKRFGDHHNVFNLRIEGRDPFSHPRQARRTKKIVSYEEEDGGYSFKHPWRCRPGGMTK